MKTQGPSPTPRCSHICSQALRGVCTSCVRHQLGPTPALPPASRALCRALSPPLAPRRAASLIEKPEAWSAGQVTHSEAAGSLRPGVGPPCGTWSWDAPRVYILQPPPQKTILSCGPQRLSVGAAAWPSGNWQRVAKGEAQSDL